MDRVNTQSGTQDVPTIEQRKALLAQALASRNVAGSAHPSRSSTRLRLDAQSLLESLQQTIGTRSHQTVEQVNKQLRLDQDSVAALSFAPDRTHQFTADPIQSEIQAKMHPETTHRGPTHARGDHNEIPALDQRLRELAATADTTAAALLEALARFDELEGWRASGAPHCVGWMNLELGISASLAREKLRVARCLRELPLIRRLFAQGELSWSKVRAMSRVATPATEQGLCIVALEVPVNTLVQLCENLRWRDPTADLDDAARDKLRLERRSLTWSQMPDGSTQFRLVLPPEMAANFRRCLERAEDKLFATEQTGQYNPTGRTPESAADLMQTPAASDPINGVPDNESIDGVSDNGVPDNGELDINSDRASTSHHQHTPTSPQAATITATQRRADAAVAMAESSLAADGIGLSSADRYQVVVHLDAEVLDAGLASVVQTAGSGSTVTTTGADVAQSSNVITARNANASTGVDAHDATDDNLQTASPEPSDPSETSVTSDSPDLPPTRIELPQAVRIALQGGTALTVPGVRRMVCDASLVTQIESHGTPISIGQKTRVWPEPMRRACLIRDGHTCAFPGCGASRWLDVHHIIHWLDGGETSMNNGVTLCRRCHSRVHDEGWMIERLPSISVSNNQRQRGTLADTLASGADEETMALVQTLESQLPRYRFYCPATDERAVHTDASTATHHGDPDRGGLHCCAESSAHYTVNRDNPAVKSLRQCYVESSGIIAVPDVQRQSPKGGIDALLQSTNDTRVVAGASG